MRSKVAKRILSETPEETKIFVRWYASLIVKIEQARKNRGWTQKELASKLEKHPSEVNKWIKGEHNFTLRSLAKLQAELGDTLLEVPVAYAASTKFPQSVSGSLKVYRNVEKVRVHDGFTPARTITHVEFKYAG